MLPNRQHTSIKQLNQHGSASENQLQRQINSSKELSSIPVQQKQSQDSFPQHQTEQTNPHVSQSLSIQNSERSTAVGQELNRAQDPSSISQYLRSQKMNSQQAAASSQANNAAKNGKQVPFAMLFPVIEPLLDKDKAMQLETIYNRLKKNEITKDAFIKQLRSLVGDQVLKMAVANLQEQHNIIPQTAAVSVTVENAALEGPLAAPSKGLVDCQYINKSVNVDTVKMGVQEQHVVENSLLDADRVRQIDFPVEGTSNSRVSSLMEKRDFGLWRGYEVNAEFVCLLDCIMQKHPETFEHFTTRNKKLSTVRLNMLCTSLNDFSKILMAEVDSEIIAQYRDIFAYLQGLGFNLSWVLSHLNYVYRTSPVFRSPNHRASSN